MIVYFSRHSSCDNMFGKCRTPFMIIFLNLADFDMNFYQAPVSDREYRATLPETAAMIDLSAKMISEGRAMDLMPREADPGAPITAYR